MTTNEDDLERLRHAKRALLEQYGDRKWFRGAGIAPSKSGLVLRLNVDPGATTENDAPPDSFQGWPVEIVFIKSYKKRD